jgi:hypothetical protein
MAFCPVIAERFYQVVMDIANVLRDLLMIGGDGRFVDGSDFGQRGE